MTSQEIIDTFELQVDDLTELSTTEELALLNRVYKRICSSRFWEFLKTEATGSILSDATGSYITRPADFMYFSQNGMYTDNTMGGDMNYNPRYIFVGSNYDPVQIVNFSDRRMYRNSTNHAYMDAKNGIIRFTGTPSASTYEFDYIARPDDLELATSPVFPSQFHDMLSYGMAVENDILQLSEKARSYMGENNAKFDEDLINMVYWNAQQMQN